jgi:hypothetical protein
MVLLADMTVQWRSSNQVAAVTVVLALTRGLCGLRLPLIRMLLM